MDDLDILDDLASATMEETPAGDEGDALDRLETLGCSDIQLGCGEPHPFVEDDLERISALGLRRAVAPHGNAQQVPCQRPVELARQVLAKKRSLEAKAADKQDAY
jgi:hypothetical protein